MAGFVWNEMGEDAEEMKVFFHQVSDKLLKTEEALIYRNVTQLNLLKTKLPDDLGRILAMDAVRSIASDAGIAVEMCSPAVVIQLHAWVADLCKIVRRQLVHTGERILHLEAE